MRVAMLAPIAWRTPPKHYGPWEQVTSLLTEELSRRGIEVTLFATADSLTSAKLEAICQQGYEEDRTVDAKVWECLHIANLFEKANQFDIIHSNFDFLPLTYSSFTTTPVLTTIHGFSSDRILPVYRRYNRRTHYVAISNSDRHPDLAYVATVYHGIDIEKFRFCRWPGDYLLFFGRIHPDKGTSEAIEIARRSQTKLVIAGIVQDRSYFDSCVRPYLDSTQVDYIGSVGPGVRDHILGQARALLHPINFEEPFGLSVVEAMACGTPVIAFNRGSMPEIITSGKDGFLVNNVDEAVEALRGIGNINPAECRKTVEQRFTVGRMADDYLRVYHEILERSGRKAGFAMQDIP